MCHVHIYHNYIPPVICGTLVGKGPRIIKNLARHPTLVFACYGNDSKHKKVPLSRNVCDGPRDASGRGGVDDLYPAHVTQLHTKRK